MIIALTSCEFSHTHSHTQSRPSGASIHKIRFAAFRFHLHRTHKRPDGRLVNSPKPYFFLFFFAALGSPRCTRGKNFYFTTGPKLFGCRYFFGERLSIAQKKMYISCLNTSCSTTSHHNIIHSPRIATQRKSLFQLFHVIPGHIRGLIYTENLRMRSN